MSKTVTASSGSRSASADAPGSGPVPRKAYSSPHLIEWGSLVDLTRGGSGAAIDYDFITTKAV